jgi:hypothetical protein
MSRRITAEPGVNTQPACSAARKELHPGSGNRQLNHEHSICLDLRAVSQLSLKSIILLKRKGDRRNTDKLVHIRDHAADGISVSITMAYAIDIHTARVQARCRSTS